MLYLCNNFINNLASENVGLFHILQFRYALISTSVSDCEYFKLQDYRSLLQLRIVSIIVGALPVKIAYICISIWTFFVVIRTYFTMCNAVILILLAI